MSKPLNPESIDGWARARSGWKRDGKQIVKEYRFTSFRDSIVFVNRIAGLADEADHHPDIEIRFDRVKVRLSSHDAGGVTERDLSLGESIDHATSARSESED